MRLHVAQAVIGYLEKVTPDKDEMAETTLGKLTTSFIERFSLVPNQRYLH